ncbi:hypothetical protein VTO42DRAFT_7455 [Malbranchea cinnamomea]
MELAICRLLATLKDTRYKVVYQAPTKSLCFERFRDWRVKFSALDLQCAELTGDTDQAQMRNAQNASIIITTPEKWDSMTRKWKDHARLIQLVKLFLIDEIHILKEIRGATLEAVVSRMKSVDSNVRFVALSATVPNSDDIATWLGRDPTNQHLPALREKFGEEFRPVKLQKFVYGYQTNGNNFAFDKVCDSKLPEIISKHSCRKPIIIFCCTRNIAISTSRNLAKLWHSLNAPSRMWNGPSKTITVQNVDLRATVSAGVAFHHAGLDTGDRHAVETGFLEGQINVICCTSTLAVGVNLPCHLVIIKNTVSWQENGCKEYSDLEMMQMLGRAGRPQFDDSAVAVILTRKERVEHYERLVAGTEPLESCLHLNLIDHLNAEIGLGTITDIESATKWLTGTFFFVRLGKNPMHYNLKDGCSREDEEEMLRKICGKDIKLLQENLLVTPQVPLKSTEFGDAMARYYVKFETMKLFLQLPPRAKISEILSAIAQADEFREIRFKSGEKSLYKELNKANGIRFPIKVDITLIAHKVSLLIQSELGAVEMPTGDQFQKHRFTFQQDKALVFSHVNRLIRCITDCQLSLRDSVGAKNALELARSFGARVWDNSALQMKQIDQIGVVAVRKLASAGINSIDDLESTEPHRIEMVLSKNPPFGSKLLAKLAEFPKPRVSVKMVGKETKPGKPVKIKFMADIGLINEKIPTFFHRRPVHICFLAETSDGEIIDFRRISATKLQKGHDILLSTELTNSYQYITCYVMCDEIAGTLRQAELKPNIPSSFFSTQKSERSNPRVSCSEMGGSLMDGPKGDKRNVVQSVNSAGRDSDEFRDDTLNDMDLLAAAEDLNLLPENEPHATPRTLPENVISNEKATKCTASDATSVELEAASVQLDNGKWACNHKCKDKTMCKHLCCREGTDRPRRTMKKKKDAKEKPLVAKKAHGDTKTSVNVPTATSAVRGGKPRQGEDGDWIVIDAVDLPGGRPVTEKDRKGSNKTNGKEAHVAENYFQRPFDRAASSFDFQPISTGNAVLLPFLEDTDEGRLEFEKDTEKNASTYLGSLPEMSDMPSPDDFFRMKLGPGNHLTAPNAETEKEGLPRANEEQIKEKIGDEAINILEGELTDYEQYANTDNKVVTPVFRLIGPSSASRLTGSNGIPSHVDSAKTPATVTIMSSPENKKKKVPDDPLSSDSLFFHGGSNTLSSSMSKRSHCQVTTGCEAAPGETPSKKSRVHPRKTEFPLSVEVNENPPPTDIERALDPSKSEEGERSVQEHVWAEIDPSVLEEYKDFVTFF